MDLAKLIAQGQEQAAIELRKNPTYRIYPTSANSIGYAIQWKHPREKNTWSFHTEAPAMLTYMAVLDEVKRLREHNSAFEYRVVGMSVLEGKREVIG